METYGEYQNANRPEKDTNYAGTSRIVVGVLLILAGIFLVLKNMNIFPVFIDDVIFSWPMLLVAIGIVLTASKPDKTAGLIVMAVGAFFLIPVLFDHTFHLYHMFWPAIFIIIGVIFIVTRGREHNFRRTTGVSGNDYIDSVNIFGGGDRQIISDNFRGGKVTCIFGGTELDLTKSRLAPGRNEIEVACVFGGVTVIVPENWSVSLEVTPVLGGFSDSRKFRPEKPAESTGELVIRGSVVFGGGEIKSY
jgi:predicted membrane protein